MKRRSFLKILSIAGAAPAVPVNVAKATSSASSQGAQYWVNYLSKYHDQCDPELLRSMMGINSKTANALYKQLVSQKVVSPIGFVNHQMATNHFSRFKELISKRTPKKTNLLSNMAEKTKKTVVKKVKKLSNSDKKPTCDHHNDIETET